MAKKVVKTVLLVSPDRIFPNNHGRVVDILSRLKKLIAQGYIVDVAYVYDQEKFIYENNSELHVLGVRNIYYCPKIFDRFFFLKFKPYQACARNLLKDLIFSNEYDVVILETLYVANALSNMSLKGKKIILRAHNDEFTYALQIAKTSGKLRSIFFIEALLNYFYQRKIFNKVDAIWFISHKDYVKFSKFKKSYFIPSDVSTYNNKSEASFLFSEPILLYIGSLTTSVNINGILWFLRNVHPLLVKCIPDYKLILAGSTKEGCDPLIEFKDSKFIEVYYNCTNLDCLYERSLIFINPVFFGGGLKIKTVTSIAKGLPVISTEVGFEGSLLDTLKNDMVFNDVTSCFNLLYYYFGERERLYDLYLSQMQIVKDNFDLDLKRVINEI